eukprot:scaffold266280_cov17-Tisochrysis_lutea.AAC.2
MDPRPFKFLVKLAVRAFYPGPCPPKDYQGDKEEGSGTKMSKLDKCLHFFAQTSAVPKNSVL